MGKAPIFVCIAVLAFGVAHAQRLPTDAELKAAYCFRVMQAMSAQCAAAKPPADSKYQKLIDDCQLDTNDRTNRLQAYLLPRMSVLDAVSIAVAMKRGETDYTTFSQTVADIATKCMQQCGYTGDTAKETAPKCAQDCANGDQLVSRIQSCNDLSWLPF